MRKFLMTTLVIALAFFGSTAVDPGRSIAMASSADECLSGPGAVCSTITERWCARWILNFDLTRGFYLECTEWITRVQTYYWTHREIKK